MNRGRERATARYEIRIAGVVGDKLAPYVDNMTSVVLPLETIVEGDVVDQAALQGLLERIQSLGLDLIHVRSLPDEPSETA